MEDLVGVGVADPAEGVRVGEGPLEGVVLADQRGAELVERGRVDLEAAGVVVLPGVAAEEHGERCPVLRAGLGEQQGAGREVEGGQGALGGQPGPGRLPVEPAGDHQVQDEPEVAVEADGDPLPEAADLADRPAVGRLHGRLERPEQERAPDPHGASVSPTIRRPSAST